MVVRGVTGVHLSPGRRPEASYSGREASRTCAPANCRCSRTPLRRPRASRVTATYGPPHLISGLLVDTAPEWPQDKSPSGTQGDVIFLVFPQGGDRLRVYLCTALDQKHRYAGRDGALNLLAEFQRSRCLLWAPAVANARPIGPCGPSPSTTRGRRLPSPSGSR